MAFELLGFDILPVDLPNPGPHHRKPTRGIERSLLDQRLDLLQFVGGHVVEKVIRRVFVKLQAKVIDQRRSYHRHNH